MEGGHYAIYCAQVMFVVLFDALILPFQLAFKILGVDGCDFQTARRQHLRASLQS